MGKKHSRNQGSDLTLSSSCSSLKDCSAQNISKEKKTRKQSRMLQGKIMSSVRINQHPLACQFGKNQEQETGESLTEDRGLFMYNPLNVDGMASYHYYQTNQARFTSNDDKYYNIHSWLDNVLKSNNESLVESESDCPSEPEEPDPDLLLIGDDYTCSCRPDQRYSPYIECAKGKSPIMDKQETSCQEKITTLKAFITKHETSVRKERLKRHNLEPTKKMNRSVKAAFRNKVPRLAYGNSDNDQSSENYTGQRQKSNKDWNHSA